MSKDFRGAKVRYGMDIGQIFAAPAADVNAVYYSRMRFHSVTDMYLRRCSYLWVAIRLLSDCAVFGRPAAETAYAD